MANQTKFQLVASTIARRSARGITAAEVAAKTGVALNTVRVYITTLKNQGVIAEAGKVETGKRGRPQIKYVAA